MRLFAAVLSVLLLVTLSPEAHALGKKRKDVGGPPDPGAPAAPPHGTFTLRTLTYNVHGLPIGPGTGKFDDIGDVLRARRDQGTAPQIVAIQEAFHTKSWQLVTHSGYPYVAVGPQPHGLRTGSGLLILSEFPFELTDDMIYGNCGGIDCMSRKGVLHARIRVPGLPSAVDYFNTHMNAGYGSSYPGKEEAERIRQRQLSDLRGFYGDVRDPSIPGFFGGDFNFKARSTNYPYFQSITSMEDGARACAELVSCSGEQDSFAHWRRFIDHTFYASGTGEDAMKVQPTHFEKIFVDASDGGKLSDHPGVEVHYELSW